MKAKRTWSIEEKVAILKEIKETGIVEGCRKHGIYATTYYDWKRKYEEKGADGLVPRYGRKRNSRVLKIDMRTIDRVKRGFWKRVLKQCWNVVQAPVSMISK